MSGKRDKFIRREVRATTKVTYDYYLVQIINLPFWKKFRFILLVIFGNVNWIASRLGYSKNQIDVRRQMKRVEKDRKRYRDDAVANIVKMNQDNVQKVADA